MPETGKYGNINSAIAEGDVVLLGTGKERVGSLAEAKERYER